ncbi:MAG: hypothetical protein IJS52_02250, partial [Bacilli bacterium]|nr:hypothetical protein [Bacilli bacterium]
IFILSPLFLSVVSLAGCGLQPATLSLYDASSRLVIQSFDDKGSITLPTYRYSKTGEVPYNEIGEFFYANGGLSNVRSSVKKVDDTYQVIGQDGHLFFTVNPKENTVALDNFGHWSGLFQLNNGIGPDPAVPYDEEACAVRPSSSTKSIGTPVKEVYNLSKYNIEAVEKDDKCYLPSAFLSNLYYRNLGADILYNGMDFYLAGAVQSGTIPAVSRSFYANENRFMAAEGKEAKSYPALQGESYRYAYQMEEGKEYSILSLTNDGKGKLLSAANPGEQGTEASQDGTTISYTWEKKDDALLVTTIVSDINPATKEHSSVTQGTWKIPLRPTFFGAKKRSKEVAAFTYDLLRFQFDHYYGLKDVAKYEDFDQYAVSKGLKERLLSEDADTYDEALAELTCKDIDDGHTRYVLPSAFSGKGAVEGKAYATKHSGPRYKGLLEKLERYQKARNEALGLKETEQAKAIGYFTKDSTALIRFDMFSNPGMFVTNMYDEGEIEKIDAAAAFQQGNVPLGFDATFYQLSKITGIKNVIIDLTCNLGGQVNVLPYILAHISKDPMMQYKDMNRGVVNEYHYKVDLNHDKKWGDVGDTYEGKYNFFILTSDFSFSCANMLPTLVKNRGAKVIGMKSGGGAATVGGFTDGLGSFYNLSSPLVSMIQEGESFHHLDAGVPVDYELAADSWYDLTKLDAFVSKLNK